MSKQNERYPRWLWRLVSRFNAWRRWEKFMMDEQKRGPIPTIKTQCRCDNCDGRGFDPIEPEHGCNGCDGKGYQSANK